MTTKEFNKRAFGKSMRGKLLSGLEISIFMAGITFLFLKFALLPSGMKSEMELEKLIIVYSIATLIVGFLIGVFMGKYPVIFSKIFSPTTRECQRYRYERRQELKEKIEWNKGVINRAEKRNETLANEIQELQSP